MLVQAGARPVEASLAELEVRKPFGFLLKDLDRGDRCSAGAFAAEADERFHRLPLSLENGLNRAVPPVVYPAGDRARFSRPRVRESKTHTLNEVRHAASRRQPRAGAVCR